MRRLSNRHRPLHHQDGVVGLILLAVVILVLVVMAGYYVYKVRSGQAEPLFGSIIERNFAA